MWIAIVQQLLWAGSVIASVWSAIKFYQAQQSLEELKAVYLAADEACKARQAFLDQTLDHLQLVCQQEMGCPEPHPPGICACCGVDWQAKT